MSRFRDELLAAAARRIDQPSEESHLDLCGALECFLRTSDAAGGRFDPYPAECDGVVLRDNMDLEGSVSEFLGFSWLVTSQKVTPLRARFWPGEDGLEFEIRFAISKIQVSEDELERLWSRGGFPRWADEWVVSLRS